MSADILVAPESVISIYRPRFWELFLGPPSNGFRISPRLSSRSHSMGFGYPVQPTSPRILGKQSYLIGRYSAAPPWSRPARIRKFSAIIYSKVCTGSLRRFSGLRFPYFFSPWPPLSYALPRTTTKTRLTAFAISVMVIDVLCRVSFYSIVDWILWELPPRYMLGANVLTIVIVSMILTVWLPPAMEVRSVPS